MILSPFVSIIPHSIPGHSFNRFILRNFLQWIFMIWLSLLHFVYFAILCAFTHRFNFALLYVVCGFKTYFCNSFWNLFFFPFCLALLFIRYFDCMFELEIFEIWILICEHWTSYGTLCEMWPVHCSSFFVFHIASLSFSLTLTSTSTLDLWICLDSIAKRIRNLPFIQLHPKYFIVTYLNILTCDSVIINDNDLLHTIYKFLWVMTADRLCSSIKIE